MSKIVTVAWGFLSRCRAAKERPIVPLPMRAMFCFLLALSEYWRASMAKG